MAFFPRGYSCQVYIESDFLITEGKRNVTLRVVSLSSSADNGLWYPCFQCNTVKTAKLKKIKNHKGEKGCLNPTFCLHFWYQNYQLPNSDLHILYSISNSLYLTT